MEYWYTQKTVKRFIKRLYNDAELRKQLSNDAFKNIENFSFVKMADRYENIYKEIILG